MIGWLAVEWLFTKTPTVGAAATGAVAGLLAITPACGTTTVTGALVIGLASSIVCYFCAIAQARTRLLR
ncbi:MAG: hypothetical protein R3F11_29340 [Verrucomicrobiales bacterium]